MSGYGPTRICGKRAWNSGPVDDVQALQDFFAGGWLAGVEYAAEFVHDSEFMRVADWTTTQRMSDGQLLVAEHSLPAGKRDVPAAHGGRELPEQHLDVDP